MDHFIVRGYPTQVNWTFNNIAGNSFSLAGYSYRLYYSMGAASTLATGVTHHGNVLTWTFTPDEQWKLGYYDLTLELYYSGVLKLTVTYPNAFLLVKSAADIVDYTEDISTATQTDYATLNIVSSIDFNRFSAVLPTVGSDGYWYINGEVVRDENGNPVPATGPAGIGITSFVKTDSVGLIDTYTITFSNGLTQTITVTNGKDGTDGVGIESIMKTATSGKVDTYTITLTDRRTTSFNVVNGNDGINGTNGVDGKGIRGIVKTSTSGLVDTYTITLTDGTTFLFTVTNGKDGTGAGDMTRLIYDSDNAIANAGGIRAYVLSVSSAAAEELTWAQLKAKRDGGALTPGRQYRITDYVATTTQANTRSANHPFDIIVTALTANTLSEEARAAVHSGDAYFAGLPLQAWRVWYCLDNDTSRFSWADTASGKGVIYRLIDEWDNDVPYDFKGIQFQRFGIASVSMAAMGSLAGLPIGQATGAYGYTIDTSASKWYYTFSKLGAAWSDEAADASVVGAFATNVAIISNNWTDAVAHKQMLSDFVLAYGPIVHTFLCTEEGITPSYSDKTYFTNLRFDGSDCTHNTIIGWAGLSITQSSFRNNLIVGSFRHLSIGTNFQSNILFCYSDFSFVTIGHGFTENKVYAKKFSAGSIEAYFRINEIEAANINNFHFCELFTRNMMSGADLGGVTFEGGQFTDSLFTGKFNQCAFRTYCQYANFVGGTNGASFNGVDFAGTIRGTSTARINIEGSDFIVPSTSGVNRRIRIEGDTNGDLVASWYSGGRLVCKTKGAAGSTWTTLDRPYFKPSTGIPATDLATGVIPSTMTGASASAAGAAGLVPAPAAGDNARYLKGDGTWGAPSATVTADDVPTETSANPVKSSGLYPLYKYITATAVVDDGAGGASYMTLDTSCKTNVFIVSAGHNPKRYLDIPSLGSFHEWYIVFRKLSDAAVSSIKINGVYYDQSGSSWQRYSVVNGEAVSVGGQFTLTIPASHMGLIVHVVDDGQQLQFEYDLHQTA